MELVGLIAIAGGLFSLAGAAFDWDWFMESRKARGLAMLLGRTGARMFYALLGVGLVVLGVLIATGILRNSG